MCVLNKLKKALLLVVIVFGLVLFSNSIAVQADDYDKIPEVPVVVGQ